MLQNDEPFRWEVLDQRLIAPKISAIADKMHKRAAGEERRIAYEVAQSGNAAGYLPRLFDFHEQLTEQWAADVYAAHCKAWKEQGRTVSPGFIRAVRDRAITPLIATRKGTVQWEVSIRATRISEPLNSCALGEWSRRMDRLAARWSSKLEAEAVAAEYRSSDQGCDIGNAELPDLLKLADGFQLPDPVGTNPFRPEDPRHQVWKAASRRAEQEVCVLNAAGIDVACEFRSCTEDEARRLVFARVSYLACAKYDIWAKRGIQIVWSDEAIPTYDQWLANYANAWLNTVKNWRFEMEGLLPELRSRLIGRMEFWKSEARRYVAEQQTAVAKREDPHQLLQAGHTPGEKPEPAPAPKRTVIGSNIDKFRKECGWSYHDLSNRTGLEKKLILGHVNKAKGLYPKTLKIYADAFTKTLGRIVSVKDLETPTG
jgi:hypothetical protein